MLLKKKFRRRIFYIVFKIWQKLIRRNGEFLIRAIIIG